MVVGVAVGGMGVSVGIGVSVGSGVGVSSGATQLEVNPLITGYAIKVNL